MIDSVEPTRPRVGVTADRMEGLHVEAHENPTMVFAVGAERSHPMATCDVCGATTSREQGTIYTATEFRQLVSKGFGPDESAIRMMTMVGMSRQQAIARWKQELVAQSPTDWFLCPSCALKAAMYIPKKAGVPLSDLGCAILGLVLTFLFPVFAGLLCIYIARKTEDKAAKILGWVGVTLNVIALLLILIAVITGVMTGST